MHCYFKNVKEECFSLVNMIVSKNLYIYIFILKQLYHCKTIYFFLNKLGLGQQPCLG